MSSSDEEGHESGVEGELEEAAAAEQEYYDEDEDEEEEEEAGKASRKKKKKKSLLEQFVIQEAEDDDFSEEEEEEEPEDGYYQAIKEQETDERGLSKDQSGHRALFNLQEREDNAEELANYFKQRYSRQHDSDRFGSSDQLSDTIVQQKLLPGVKDPNLWTVKCKSGEEKLTALWLMRKYAAVKEGLRGFIYVEAYKQTHVKAAIEDISNLKMGLWKQEVRAPTAGSPS